MEEGAGGSSVLSNLLHGGSKRVRQRVINTKIRSPRGGHYHLTPRTKTYNEHCEFPNFPSVVIPGKRARFLGGVE